MMEEKQEKDGKVRRRRGWKKEGWKKKGERMEEGRKVDDRMK